MGTNKEAAPAGACEHWFTSDQHFGHKNIIEYAERPFRTVDEMDRQLIENWNNCVAPGDIVWNLGDFTLSKDKDRATSILEQLNGRHRFVFGNHDDRALSLWAGEFRERGLLEATYSGFVEHKVNGQRIVMCHYAMEVWNRSHHGAWMLHGHSHGTLREDLTKLRLDVGVDWAARYFSDGVLQPTDYRPLNFAQIAEIMREDRSFVPVDHHGKKEYSVTERERDMAAAIERAEEADAEEADDDATDAERSFVRVRPPNDPPQV